MSIHDDYIVLPLITAFITVFLYTPVARIMLVQLQIFALGTPFSHPDEITRYSILGLEPVLSL